MGEPFSLISAGAGFAITAGKFIDKLASVKDDTGIIIQQLKVITEDILEAVNLRHRNKPYLTEADIQRADRVIEGTKHAVMRVAKHVEPARRGVAKTGTVNMVDRFDWVFRKSSAVESYQHSLNTCQQSLQGQITKLRMAPRVIQAQMPPPYNEPSYMDRDAYPDDEGTLMTSVDDDTDFVSDEDVDERPPMPQTSLGDPFESVEHKNKLLDTRAPTQADFVAERLMYEEMQRIPRVLGSKRILAKRILARGQLHPERELYDEMQQDSRRNK